MKKIFLLIIMVLFPLISFSQKGEATEQERVLLVYDSLNLANAGEKNVDSLQRLLTSLGVKVDTVQDNAYLENTLRDDVYTGVISFVNWSEKGLQSDYFRRDRKNFEGKKLHIGMGLDQTEQAGFAGSFRQLSHRQYTLVHNDEAFQQLLDYQDQSMVLETEDGQLYGQLISQELEEKKYPFGVIQGKNAFLPMYDTKGAVFLQSAELIQQWLGKSSNYQPLLTFKGFSPLNDMEVANDFLSKINKMALYYTLSTTSINRNNDLLTYEIFTDILAKAQESAVIFLAVPAVNSADLNDGRVLQTIMTEQISLLVSHNIYPIGLSAPGYWNQDSQYRLDGLSFGKTVILEENPAVDNMHYRAQDDRAPTYATSFYSLEESALDRVQWKEEQTYLSYLFPMPVSLAFNFPKDETEEKSVLAKINELKFDFSQSLDSQYTFELNTQTQRIAYTDGRFTLNGQGVSQFADSEQVRPLSNQYQGLFAGFFRRINTGLIIFIGSVLILLVILFVRGNRNYRSKYVSRGGKRK
ncbi:hypothetical protein ACYSNR_06425 [Enterococcus sp. LJL128]